MADPASIANRAATEGALGGKTEREVEVLLKADASEFKREMQGGVVAVEGITAALIAAEEAYKGFFRTVGSAMVGLGAGAQAVATGGLWSAAQFEEQFARVAKTTGLQDQSGKLMGAFGLGGAELSNFQAEIRGLSTEMPVAVQELAHLADVAGTLGVESENLALFAQTAAELGAGINELGSAQAIAGLSNLMGAMGDDEASIRNLGSALAELSNHTRAGADQILNFSDRVAGMAVQVGMGSEEVLAWGASISLIGANAELGATAMTDFMQRISRAVQSGGRDLDQWANAVGESTTAFAEAWEEDPTQVMLNFLHTLSLQGEEAITTLDNLGIRGTQMTQILGGMAAQFDDVAAAHGISNEAFREGTAVAELAQIRFDTLISSLRTFRQSTAEVARSLGQGLLRPAQMLVDRMTDLINVFNVLPAFLKTTMGAMLGLGGAAVTVVGGIALMNAKLAIALHALRAGADVFGAVAGWFNRMGEGAGTASRMFEALAGHSRVMHNATEGVPGLFAKVTAAGVQLAKVLKLQVVAGFNAVTAAAGTALKATLTATTAAFTRMTQALRGLGGWLNRDMWRNFAFGMTAAGQGARGLLRSLRPLVAFLGKWGLILAGITAAGYKVGEMMGWWGEQAETLEDQLRGVAEAVDMSLGEFSGQSTIFATEAMKNLGEEAEDLVNILEGLDDESSKDFITRYGMVLVAQGQDPEDVKDLINDLRELAGQGPIEFNVSINAMTTEDFGRHFRKAAGATEDSLEKVLPAAGHTPEERYSWAPDWTHLGADQEKITSDSLVGAVGEDLIADFRATLRPALEMTPDQNLAAQFAMLHQQQQAIVDAWEDDDISRNVAESFLGVVSDEFGKIIPEFEVDRGNRAGRFTRWGSRSVLDAIPGGRVRPFGEDPRERSFQHEGADLGDAQQAMGDLFADENFFPEENVRSFANEIVSAMHGLEILPEGINEFGEAIREAGSSTEDTAAAAEWLQESIHDLSREEFSALIEQIEDVGIAMQEGLVPEEMDRWVNDLHETWGEMRKDLDDQEFSRFAEDLFSGLPDQIGFARAMEEANEMLQAVIDDADHEWADDVHDVQQAIEAMAEQHFEQLDQRLGTEGALDAIQIINQELMKLANSETQHDVVIDMMVNLRQERMRETEQELRGAMQQYDDLHERRADAVDQHSQRIEDMEEQHAKRVESINEQHADRITDMEERKNSRLEELETRRQDQRERHAERMADIDEREQEALEDQVERVNQAFGLIERIQSRPSASGDAIVHNMEQQNRVMAEMTANVDQLRSMGLDDDVIEELGLHDPQNFAQAQRLLENALSDPSVIDRINSEWATRLQVGEAFVDETSKADIKADFDEMREEARKAHRESMEDLAKAAQEIREDHAKNVADAIESRDKAIADATESHADQVSRLTESHEDQIADIDEAISELASNSIEDISDLIERAMESGVEGIEELAKRYEDAVNISELIDSMIAERQAEDVGTGNISAFLRGIGGKFRDVIQAAGGYSDETMDTIDDKFGKGVDVALNTMSHLATDQPAEVWAESILKAQAGADDTVDAIDEIFREADFTEGLLEGLKDSFAEAWKIIQEENQAEANRNSGFQYIGGGPMGDGPGRMAGMEGGYRMGPAAQRASQIAQSVAGTYVTSTYRDPAHNASVGGSPTSYHMDASNPAIDFGGPTHALDQLYERLRQVPHRELLWRTAGHWDHVHFANEGMLIPGFGDRDTVPAMLTPGEFVLNARAVEHYGPEMIDAINRMEYLNAGGRVGMRSGSRGRESVSGGEDLVGAFTKALERVEMGGGETNHWNVDVKARSVDDIVAQLEQKKRISRLTTRGYERG